ncbi:MAG: HpcH/HpaI aldolase family protein [Planctomycetota bacterium]
MNGRELIEALHGGRPVFGTMIASPSPRYVAAAKGAGLDFVFIDTEHTPIGRETLSWMCHLFAAAGLPPVVRVPQPDPFLATMALDGGAEGVIFPYVESPAQAQALRGATKLRPLKGRRLGAVLAGDAELEPELADYLAQRNAGSAMILNIESVPAIEALDAILAVPGLDAVLIGPHDLSCSLGVPEQYDHPRFEEAVRTIFAKARDAGVGAGIHYWGSIDRWLAWAQAGANLIIHSIDSTLFAAALRRDLAALRDGIAGPDAS